jgi:hypothetical protein
MRKYNKKLIDAISVDTLFDFGGTLTDSQIIDKLDSLNDRQYNQFHYLWNNTTVSCKFNKLIHIVNKNFNTNIDFYFYNYDQKIVKTKSLISLYINIDNNLFKINGNKYFTIKENKKSKLIYSFKKNIVITNNKENFFNHIVEASFNDSCFNATTYSLLEKLNN